MANKKVRHQNLDPYKFKPGQSGNPSGRPKLPEDLKKARRLNQIEVGRLMNRFSDMSIGELRKLMENPSVSTLDLMIGKIVIEAIKHGDQSRLNFILDRMIGKVTEKVEHKLPKPTVIKLFGEDAVMVLGNQKEEEE